MDRLDVERLGGFAGFGSPGSRLRSRGQVAKSGLTPAVQASVDALFEHLPPDAAVPRPDGFRYRITRHTAAGPQSIEVAEQHVPAALRDSVKDEIV